ncbi:condensation domain-containing protein [Nonomuraea angiospora]|uniref:Acyl carrier protein n=1 Tax=Nonomuraea angiospora TaxID=46172 RepID=A0ABR9MLH2_9ACTN|nr:condensation domain-containing protein [Nonomuraea angiospora]MBE1593806.1 acyl carrier protein [Nonomuraea angiospora]
MVLASQAQHGMWITEMMHGGGTAYHMPFAMWFDGPLDRGAMLKACESVLARHPVLGCAFEDRDGELHLVPAADRPPIGFVRAADVDGLVREEIARPFDLGRGPLARFTLAEVGASRHLLLFVGHHLVFDGMSKDLLVRDLAAAYSGGPLPPLPMPYGSAAATPPEATAYWHEHWRDRSTVVIDGVAGTARTAGRGETVLLDLTDEMSGWEGVGVTRFELFLAAVHALLFRYGNAEPAVAVAMSTRRPETREHIGLFATELPLYSAPTPDTTLAELAHDLRARLRDLNRFRDIPAARAAGGIRPRPALAPVSISFRRRAADVVFPGLGLVAEWKMSNHMVRNVLHLQAVDGDDGLRLTLHHSPDVIGREHVERAGEHLRAVLAADPGLRLADLPLPTATPTPTTASEPVPTSAPGEAPTADGELVEQVRQIWMEVLRIEELAPDEDLYDLGGHSLTITQISARIRKRLGVEVPFDVFLDDPTVAGVAAAVSELRA